MRAVVQRVSSARVVVAGEEVAAIGRGLLVLLGVRDGDGEREAEVLAGKTSRLRIFPDERKPMNRSVLDIGGEALVVSQFTLAGDVSKGNRPSFVHAAAPDEAERLYRCYAEALARAGVPTRTGRFGASMDVHLVNAGPVTFVLDLPPGAGTVT
jgi:D-tyrosyl-tRNA(Tyr) deacylase